MSAVQPFVPATEALLSGWTGPVEWLDTFRNPEGVWYVSAYGAGGMANGADPARVRLDTRRREVQHLLCDRLNLPKWVRGSEWCAALTWWSALSGRRIAGLATMWGTPDEDLWYVEWAESDVDAFRKAVDRASVPADVAYYDLVDGRPRLTLPPIRAGGEPAIWSLS